MSTTPPDPAEQRADLQEYARQRRLADAALCCFAMAGATEQDMVDLFDSVYREYMDPECGNYRVVGPAQQRIQAARTALEPEAEPETTPDTVAPLAVVPASAPAGYVPAHRAA